MEQFSHKLANMFYDANIISSDAVENYAYAIESLIVKVIGWSVLLCLAFVTGWFKELLCYLVFFAAVRAYGGGFHCKSLRGCLLISAISLLLPILLYRMTFPFPSICQGWVIISIIVDIWIGSVNNESIDWDQQEFKKAKRNNRIIVLIEVTLILLFYLTRMNTVYIFFMSYGLIMASLSMIIEYILKKGGWNHEGTQKETSESG